MRLETFSYSNAEDQRWLGNSTVGAKETESITIAPATFLATFPSGIIPSGVAVGKITAPGVNFGKYGKYDNTATDGREVCAGVLFTYTNVRISAQYPTGSDTTAALYNVGKITESKLPVGHGIDAAAKADLKLVLFR